MASTQVENETHLSYVCTRDTRNYENLRATTRLTVKTRCCAVQNKMLPQPNRATPWSTGPPFRDDSHVVSSWRQREDRCFHRLIRRPKRRTNRTSSTNQINRISPCRWPASRCCWPPAAPTPPPSWGLIYRNTHTYTIKKNRHARTYAPTNKAAAERGRPRVRKLVASLENKRKQTQPERKGT